MLRLKTWQFAASRVQLALSMFLAPRKKLGKATANTVAPVEQENFCASRVKVKRRSIHQEMSQREPRYDRGEAFLLWINKRQSGASAQSR